MKIYYQSIQAGSYWSWTPGRWRFNLTQALPWFILHWCFHFSFNPWPTQDVVVKMRRGEPWEILHRRLCFRLFGLTTEWKVRRRWPISSPGVKG